jgi:hypothetical protein
LNRRLKYKFTIDCIIINPTKLSFGLYSYFNRTRIIHIYNTVNRNGVSLIVVVLSNFEVHFIDPELTLISLSISHLIEELDFEQTYQSYYDVAKHYCKHKINNSSLYFPRDFLVSDFYDPVEFELNLNKYGYSHIDTNDFGQIVKNHFVPCLFGFYSINFFKTHLTYYECLYYWGEFNVIDDFEVIYRDQQSLYINTEHYKTYKFKTIKYQIIFAKNRAYNIETHTTVFRQKISKSFPVRHLSLEVSTDL